MHIYNFSPSQLNTLDSCEMKWFLQYMLKYRELSGKAAAIGTCCHAILEAVAESKKLRQDNKTWCNNKIFGRINKSYKLDKLTEKAVNWIKEDNPHIKFEKKDIDQIYSNIEIAKDDPLFPENHKKIIATESFFNDALNFDWATYSKIGKDGSVESKPLRIIGFIDLVYLDHNDEVNYLDYKFGSLKDWVTGKEKNYSNLQEDTQLCLYYWHVSNKFKEYGDIKTNIWYVKQKKKFGLYFDNDNVLTAMSKVKDAFLKIKGMTRPSCNYTWKCKNFCPFSKNSFTDFGQNQLDVDYEHHKSKFDDVNGKLSICDAMNMFFDNRDLNIILENCRNVQHK